MAYSSRQLGCMSAMGLVAWTCKDVSESLTDSILKNQPEHLALSTPTPTPTPIAASNAGVTDGSGLAALAQWLVEQPLLPLVYRGATVSYIGQDQSALLVVCLHSGTPQASALDPGSEQLFDLMMRAINMPRNAITQCAVAAKPFTPAGSTQSSIYLDAICTAHTRAILVLDPDSADLYSPVEAEHGRMPTSSLPVWRLPHPDLLLQTPALKRRAWETLKALQLMLLNQ